MLETSKVQSLSLFCMDREQAKSFCCLTFSFVICFFITITYSYAFIGLPTYKSLFKRLIRQLTQNQPNIYCRSENHQEHTNHEIHRLEPNLNVNGNQPKPILKNRANTLIQMICVKFLTWRSGNAKACRDTEICVSDHRQSLLFFTSSKSFSNTSTCPVRKKSSSHHKNFLQPCKRRLEKKLMLLHKSSTRCSKADCGRTTIGHIPEWLCVIKKQLKSISYIFVKRKLTKPVRNGSHSDLSNYNSAEQQTQFFSLWAFLQNMH